MAARDLLSTRELARICGVSESTIKRWADEGLLRCLKTPGGHRKFRLEDVSEFAHTHQFGLEDLGELNERQQVQLGVERLLRARDHEPMRLAFLEALLSGDRLTALHLLRRATDAGHDLALLIDQVITPAMNALGERWAAGHLRVEEEHRASQILLDAIGELRAKAGEPRRVGPLAIGACPPGEQHTIGVKLLLTVLAQRGWRTIDLGADTPWDGIALMVEGHRADLVLLSSSGIADAAEFVEGFERIAQPARQRGAQLAIGGPGFTPEILTLIQYDHHFSDATTLVERFGALSVETPSAPPR